MTRRQTRLRHLVVAFTLLASVAAPARGQQAGSASGAAEAQLEQTVRTAPVIVDGAVLFRVRGVTSFPADERAAAIAGRIKDVAANRAFQPEALRLEETEIAIQILADRQVLMNVVEADARLEGVSQKVLATICLNRIRTAIVAYRAERSPAAEERAALGAVAATVVFALVLLAIIWVWRRMDAMLENRYRERVESLAAKSREVVSATRLWSTLRAVMRFARSAAIVVLAFMYVDMVLDLFVQTRPFARSLIGYVVSPLTTMWASFVGAIPDLMFLGILAVVVRIILRMLRRFFDAVAEGRIHLENFDREWAAPTYKLVRPVIVAFAVIVGYPYIPGSNSEAFKGVSIFLGIVFSLGSSSFIANMIAGFSMTYRRAFKLGELVQIGDVTGVVTAIRLQATHVRTIKNEEVVIPNSQILGTHVTNFSTLAQSDGLILHTTVGIGYETPWRQVEGMLLEAARRTPGLMTEPAPFVFHLQLGDFCVTYELNVYCRNALKMRATYTELHRNILDLFNEYGVQIMTPAYEGDPEVPKVVPKEQWYLAPAKPDAAPAEPRPRP